eukprot:4905003-Pyramimonas_sp.AAC.1
MAPMQRLALPPALRGQAPRRRQYLARCRLLGRGAACRAALAVDCGCFRPGLSSDPAPQPGW